MAQEMLTCPLCKVSVHTHIDGVTMAGRPLGEDKPVRALRIDRDMIVSEVDAEVDMSTVVSSRRHAITLHGWCEECGESFIIGFDQNKGSTYVTHMADPTATPHNPSKRRGA